MNPLIKFFRWLIVDLPAQKTSLRESAQRMKASGETILAHIAAVPDTEENRQQLRHIIGIERWGQSRLRVPLGEPLKHDEYDNYAPPSSHSWETLQADFQETRQQTLLLIQALMEANSQDHGAILHNDLGKMTVHGWLRYLGIHAKMESQRIK